MIGKVTTGKGFNGCLSYCMGKEGAEVLLNNNCYGNKNDLTKQFNEIRKLNSKVSKPVWHATLSFSKKDTVDDKLMTKVASEYSSFFGLENNQFVVVKHCDTEHAHFHIVANRIDYSGKTLSDSNNYKKTSDFCRKMEMKFDLEKVEAPNKFKEKKTERNDSRKEVMKTIIDSVLRESINFQEFIKKLKEKKIDTIKGRGISFMDEKKVKVKGSDIGFSLSKIEKKFVRQMKLERPRNRGLSM